MSIEQIENINNSLRINNDNDDNIDYAKALHYVKSMLLNFQTLKENIKAENLKDVLISRVVYLTSEYYRRKINDLTLTRVISLGQYNLDWELEKIVCLSTIVTQSVLTDNGIDNPKLFMPILRLFEVILLKESILTPEADIYCAASKIGVNSIINKKEIQDFINKEKSRYKSNAFIANATLNELKIFGILELNKNLELNKDYSKDMVVLNIGLLCNIITNSCYIVSSSYDILFKEIYDLYYLTKKN